MSLNNTVGKKNVLVFTLSPPLPAASGAPIYVMNTLMPLADKYNLHLFTIGGEKEVAHISKHREIYERYFKSVHVEPRAEAPAEKGLYGQIKHSLEHIYHGLPFMDASYYSADAVSNARRIVQDQKIDLMEIHSSHLAFFKKFIDHVPAVLVSHNIETDIFPFWIPQHLKGWKRKAVELVAQQSRKNAHEVEAKNKWKFEAITFISQRDMERCTASTIKAHLPLCLPIKPGKYRNKPQDEVNLLWMGGFWWYPNAEAVVWFAKEIFPKIQDKLKANNINLHFLGDAPPSELVAIANDQNVFVHGFVESIDDMLKKTHMLFVPLLSGGGVRVKILEAMSNGIPVLSTTKGCEGLGVTDGKDIVVRDDAEAFANAMLELAGDPQRREQLSKAAVELLNNHYNLGHCVLLKDEIYQKVSISTKERNSIR